VTFLFCASGALLHARRLNQSRRLGKAIPVSTPAVWEAGRLLQRGRHFPDPGCIERGSACMIWKKNILRKGQLMRLMPGTKALLFCAITALPVAASADRQPKLILQITVDQLRGDMPTRHLAQFGEGGFRYLLEKGIHYNNAHHTHANTETIVGHTTLATGANPAAHGMVGNLWYDREEGRTVYNIEDPDFSILTRGADVDVETEIDPTQRAAKSDGRSPRNILTSTFGDELAVHTAGKAKVFGVSIKDRGAVAMAGHTGKAFWFSKAVGEFVTSDYYYDAYPDWVDRWNEKRLPQSFGGQSWELLNAADTYIFPNSNSAGYKPDFAGFGSTFPHPLGEANGKYFTTLLTLSPFGDRITADFAKALIDAEDLGDDDVTDFLAISFSVTDYVGHFFGPSSLEAEDNLLHLDRTLADLFAYLDAEVGLENTLIVLSSDHGAPEAPGYLASIGMPGDYVTPEAWNTAPAIERIKARFGLTGALFEGYDHPYLTLAADIRANPDIDRVALETAIADELVSFQGVAYAIPSSRLREGSLPDNALMQAVLNNYHPDRSGDIYLVFQPEWFINDMDGLSVTVTHGSPWRYDTFVPILFAGEGISPDKVSRRVHTIDIALTLSVVAGTRPPSGATGEVLLEVLGQ
jgi:predicted AlkP superfamily pyrophosphatase or phosphodiesterase